MEKDLTVGKPMSVIWKFCLPLFGSIIFQQLYNLADSFVAGKFIGDNALAAVGNSYEITLIFIAFAFGCNIGCSVIVSKYFGAKKYHDMKTAVFTTWIAGAVLNPYDFGADAERNSFGTYSHAERNHGGLQTLSGYLRMGFAVCVFL